MTYPILFQFWDFINPKVLIKVDELLPMVTVIALTGNYMYNLIYELFKNGKYILFYFLNVVLLFRLFFFCEIDKMKEN